jgi:hypothetical protein
MSDAPLRTRITFLSRETFIDSDLHHPSLLGSALAAQVFYASLLARSPEGLPRIPGLDAETSQALQRIAWLEAQAARRSSSVLPADSSAKP